ncbi:hypothetical protein JNUCC1_00096 [Lentibacillus sp. JNUCC-1]|uniref:aspartyl-phosphate phosphatase Spo0E family protein n=1 Tax=Lentibacillus sp. JNUCC-1 TaxID=2654513 RepID=UPI0012E90063|nr:aspartyl-phosphate phosphatase Spo0E family protein [Lentibacillus sp. JNUCC-1]MUV36295.1 hypothetical protein [Lentibacillus sp. JNUCC-1]
MKMKEQRLLEKIEHLRRVMHKTAENEGLTGPNSIQISQQLDELMNEYEINRKHKEKMERQ